VRESTIKASLDFLLLVEQGRPKEGGGLGDRSVLKPSTRRKWKNQNGVIDKPMGSCGMKDVWLK